MKALLIMSIVTSVLALDNLSNTYDLNREVENAKSRFDNDFLLGVWYRSNEAIIESKEKLLKLYTHYTVQQAEQLIGHIFIYKNWTQNEASQKRDEALSTKNISKIMKFTDCIFKNEDATIQAYKMTGYNLHNCIRMAQMETETSYLEIVKNFEHIKKISVEIHDYYSQKVQNCLDKMCVLSSLVQSVVHYEKLQEEIATNVTETNSINTRYLLAHIALGCVKNGMNQIEENYKIGKKLINDCFLLKNETEDLMAMD